MALDEVTIDMQAGTAWGIPIGDGRDDSPTVVIFHADDVAVALRDEQVHWPSLDSMTVTPAGFATLHRRRDSLTFIFELFPARWGDGNPYQPLVYVGSFTAKSMTVRGGLSAPNVVMTGLVPRRTSSTRLRSWGSERWRFSS